jgi:hypothetical protein
VGSHFEAEVVVVVDIAEDHPCSSSVADSREDSNSSAAEVEWNFADGHVPCYG